MRCLYYFVTLSLIFPHSCINYSNVWQTLNQAESLMRSHPDSAYTLLSAMTIDRISHRGIKAQYALLYTEALIKTNRPIENDSIINLAVDYYNRKATLCKEASALYYQGCTRVQMNKIEDAFQSFKRAHELASKLEDDYLVGLVSVEIAELYEQQRHLDQSLEWYRQALAAYQNAGKELHICYALNLMSKLFLLQSNVDSAMYYCQAARVLAVQIKNEKYEYDAIMNLTNAYRRQKEYVMAKDILFDNINRFKKDIVKENDILRLLSLLYYDMNQTDSARHYASLIALDSLRPEKRLGALLLRKLIEEKAGDHKAAMVYYTQYMHLSEEILQHNQLDDLNEMEARYNQEKLKSENYALKNRVLSMVIAFSIISFVTFLLVRFLIRRLKRRAKFHEENLRKMSILREDELIARSQKREKQLKEIVEHRFSIAKGLLDLSYINDLQSTKFIERFRAAMALSGKPGETFFADLVPFMNSCYFGVIDYLRGCHKDLNDSDVELICLLFFKFSPQQLCALYGMEQVGAIYTRCSRVAKKLKIEKGVSIRQFLEGIIGELKTQKGL